MSRVPGRGEILEQIEEGPAGAVLSLRFDPAADLLERALRELVRYYRHSGVGRRCLGIVHRMNTPLQVLSFQLELLEQKSREELAILSGCEPAVAAELGACHEFRGKKLFQFRGELETLQQLTRTLAEQGSLEACPGMVHLDLNRVFQQELEIYLAQPFFRHQVTRDFSFCPDLPPIYGHYIDFSQVLRILVDNALEAMAGRPEEEGSGGGAVSPRLTVYTARQEGERVLAVGDTGGGIAPEHLPLVFDPFCTTKGPAHAGLGLFMARRLLAPYSGKITVSSAPGETWAKVSWPIA